MNVTYIDHMGTDLSVVNAARVSFAKKHEEMGEGDGKLINYLARHGHWTPFGHTSVTLHCKAPIFIARQLGKSQVGLVWNEVSRRYVDDTPEFYDPEYQWRTKASNVKQGSAGLAGDATRGFCESEYWYLMDVARGIYEKMLSKGVCPEQARMVLPQSMMTEWYWTGSIAAWARVYGLRIAPHAQKEVQFMAEMIDSTIGELYPISWKALTSKHLETEESA